MLPVLNAQQIRAVDSFTIAHEPVASIDLMERACRAFVNWFMARFPVTRKIIFFCGPGNNGGDGLGSARLLIERGYTVSVFVVGNNEGSPDFQVNLQRLQKLTTVRVIDSLKAITPLSDAIIVDALFGSGLSRPLEGLSGEVVNWMNQQQAVRVAMDIPSGLLADKSSEGPIVKADYTATFQVPKLTFLLPECFEFVGEWTTLDIGLDQSALSQQHTPYHLIEEEDIRLTLHPRSRFDHKGTYGKALLVCGGYGKMGAAILASRAAIRSGLGLLVTHVPATGYQIIQTAVPEAMASVDADAQHFTSVPELGGYEAVGVGPGIGTHVQTAHALAELMRQFGKPMVLDADALNLLAAHREMLHLVPSKSILTPHPGEFRRLVGKWGDGFERLHLQLELAKKLDAVVLVKGAFTTIVSPDGQFYFNPTGNPGMATGGMGDVLTGLITGFLAQGYPSTEAAISAAYLHGRAGDLAAAHHGLDALCASDLINSLFAAFSSIRPEKQGL